MSLTPPEKVRKLQQTLHEKAKEQPTYRFYALYDKLYRMDVLRHSWAVCRKHKRPGRGTKPYSFQYLTSELGLVTLQHRPRSYV